MENKPRKPYSVRRTPEQIKEILEKFEQSGQTATAYAAANGLAFSTLMGWHGRYRSKPVTNHQPQFVELNSVGITPGEKSVAQIRFVDGLSMELHAGFAAEPVAQLIGLLRVP